MECQHHNNCGGYCETEEEEAHALCCDCLEADRDRNRDAAMLADLLDAIARIGRAAGLVSGTPAQIADHVCARLNEIQPAQVATN